MKKYSLSIKILLATFFYAWLICKQNLFAQESNDSIKANITISFSQNDSLRQVIAKLTARGAGATDTAIKGVDIHFYVKKSFGLLPLEGDNLTTDENGEAMVDFPADLPGDATGNLVVVAKVEDDERLGNIEATKTVKWGIALKQEQATDQRALWASANNAPWSLVIIVSGLVMIVWGMIVYIFIQLILIKKAGKYSNKKLTI